MKFKESITIFLKGIFMGVADIIPGVSGGTIALITGIYERIVKAINSVNDLFFKPLSEFRFKKTFQNFVKFDFALLIPLLLGIFVSFLTLANVMDYLLENFTSFTYAFFFGLILASAIFVYKFAGKKHVRNIFYLALGLIFGFWFVGLNALINSHSLLITFLSGAIAICAMILPGISGAFILVILGQYEHMIGVIKGLVLFELFIFSIGALIGILSFSRLLAYLLRKYKGPTMSFLAGLMIGSLRMPFNQVVVTNEPIFALIFGIIGFVIVFLLEKKFSK